MDKVAFKQAHEAFVKQSNDLRKVAKDKVFAQIMAQLDIAEVVSDPQKAKSDIHQLFIQTFGHYFNNAVMIGRQFGQEKIKLING